MLLNHLNSKKNGVAFGFICCHSKLVYWILLINVCCCLFVLFILLFISIQNDDHSIHSTILVFIHVVVVQVIFFFFNYLFMEFCRKKKHLHQNIYFKKKIYFESEFLRNNWITFSIYLILEFKWKQSWIEQKIELTENSSFKT